MHGNKKHTEFFEQNTTIQIKFCLECSRCNNKLERSYDFEPTKFKETTNLFYSEANEIGWRYSKSKLNNVICVRCPQCHKNRNSKIYNETFCYLNAC